MEQRGAAGKGFGRIATPKSVVVTSFWRPTDLALRSGAKRRVSKGLP
jgi:hypothetical protein